jgi:hypothetical protein
MLNYGILKDTYIKSNSKISMLVGKIVAIFNPIKA